MSGSRDAASTDLRKNDTKEVGTYQPLIFMPNSNSGKFIDIYLLLWYIVRITSYNEQRMKDEKR